MLFFKVIAAAALIGGSSGQSTALSSMIEQSSGVSTTPQATASQASTPQNFTIDNFTFAGRSCPTQTAGLSTGSDLVIRTGVNSKPSVRLCRFCQIHALDSMTD
jgi:hypothetical protein